MRIICTLAMSIAIYAVILQLYLKQLKAVNRLRIDLLTTIHACLNVGYVC